jgi:exosortase
MIPENSPRKLLIALGVLCLLGLVVLYGFLPYTYSHLMHMTSVTGALWAMWNGFPDFMYGMLVPPLAAIVIYLQRKQLVQIPVNGWWPGIVFVALSLALFWAGRRVDNQYIGFFSIQILLATLVLWLMGWRWLSALAFPLAFLVFTWPMPFLDNMVTFPLRMFMSGSSVSVLNLFGLAVVQNGTGIHSAANPDMGLAEGKLFEVDVADPCSGIRSLFALMMISALYGHFTLHTPWKRAALFLSSVPLAIAGNLARILMLTLGIVTIGAPTAIGTLDKPTLFHEAAGYVVFLVALGGMLLICRVLSTSRDEWRSKWRLVKTEVKNSTAPAPPARTQTDIY